MRLRFTTAIRDYDSQPRFTDEIRTAAARGQWHMMNRLAKRCSAAIERGGPPRRSGPEPPAAASGEIAET
ncbi:hypothetical protein BGC_13650 [Burkholderia sp. 3C]